MATDSDPVVGNWYQHLDKGQKFEVVAIDEDQGLVEIQHFDGDLEEIDIDEWYELDIELSEAPENWSGPVDSFEEEALDYSETEMEEEDWALPADEYDRGAESRPKRAKGGPAEPGVEGGDEGGGEESPEGPWREEES